jgi:hypothetical protein
MASAETPAAECPKSWKERMGPIMHIVFWMIVGAFVFNAIFPEKPPQQGLRITNTGSQSVEIRRLARWSWQEDEWTLPPGETFIGTFAVEQFQFTRSNQAPPEPGVARPEYLTPRFVGPDGREFMPSRSYLWGDALHQNADGSGTVLLRHVDRTAEVRVNEAGKIEFEFTDL